MLPRDFAQQAEVLDSQLALAAIAGGYCPIRHPALQHLLSFFVSLSVSAAIPPEMVVVSKTCLRIFEAFPKIYHSGYHLHLHKCQLQYV